MRYENIYREFEAFTDNISANLIMIRGKPYGKVVSKYSKSGLTVTAYVHLFGCEMVKGKATGCGYDKTSVAVENAFQKLKPASYGPLADKTTINAWKNVMKDCSGQEWSRHLQTFIPQSSVHNII